MRSIKELYIQINRDLIMPTMTKNFEDADNTLDGNRILYSQLKQKANN